MALSLSSKSKKPSRVLILIPSPYFYYFNLGMSLRQAFSAEGVDSLVLVDRIDDNAMLALLSTYRPDVVFSINSFKRPVMEQFPEMLHIRWIQDNQFGADFRKETADPDSDFCYTATQRCMADLHVRAKRKTGILRFGANPTDQGMPAEIGSVFSLIAYIPSAKIFDFSFEVGPDRKFTGWDFFDYFSALQQNCLDTQPELSDQITEVFLSQYGTTSKNVPEQLLVLFREDYVRAINRCRFMQKVLSLGFGCSIYGMSEWESWPQFAPHYRGPIITLDANYQVFRDTMLNLHNGGTMSHPRVFECMASLGGPIFANRTYFESELDFEPGVHYVEYDLSDFEAQARELLENHERRERMSRAAFDLVCSRHTWGHRVRQILADIAAFA